MNLFLTTRGRWLLALGLMYCLAGALTSSPVLIIIGQIPIVLLVVAIFLYLPGAMTLDRRLIQLRLHPANNPDFNKSVSSTHVVGDDIPFILEVTNDSPTTLHGFRAIPFTSAHISSVQPEIPRQPITIHRASKVQIPLTLRASKAGRRAVQGFDLTTRDPLGLIECIDYLPANHVFECYPAVGKMRRPNNPRNFTVHDATHTGRPTQRIVTSGSDIRELRDYHPGEPLKNIAWKASARARKLIARDFEADAESNFYVLLDISGTMRTQQQLSDAPNKLDRAIEYITELAQTLARNRQPLGLITFDERIYAHVAPNTGSTHLRRILNHLTTLNSIADPDRTELDEAELLSFLADYLLIQERLDFRIRKNGKSSINTELLDRWLQNVLPREIHRFSTPSLSDALIEPNSLTPARHFLQLRGVAIPPRGETRHGLKERSISEAIELLSKSTRQQRQQIIVITDLLGIVNLDLLTRTIKLARAKGHNLQFLIPSTAQSQPQQHPSASVRYKIIHELFTATESQDRQKILQHLQALSIPTSTLS